jgi:hypothetical protein
MDLKTTGEIIEFIFAILAGIWATIQIYNYIKNYKRKGKLTIIVKTIELQFPLNIKNKFHSRLPSGLMIYFGGSMQFTDSKWRI